MTRRGAFSVARNPISTAILVFAAGIALMTPNPLAIVGFVLLLATIELQVRVVEEPYLLRVHADAYQQYTRSVGRFVPGIGRGSCGPTERNRVSTIVVGVDGSAGSQVVLQWALEEARRRGSAVRAVHAWQLPYHQGYIGHLALERLHEPLAEAARQTLISAALAGDSIDVRGVNVTPVAREGPPARVLIDAAADADLLVVGSRGHGGFAGLLLGSVSQQCAQGGMCRSSSCRYATTLSRGATAIVDRSRLHDMRSGRCR